MTTEQSRPRALITGASAGIGRGFAEHLARRNYDLVLVARRRDRLEQVAADLAPDHGVSVSVVEADLATDAGVASVEARLAQGGIDLLVNNAGFGTFGEFAALPVDRELEVLDVNVRALMRLCHAALGKMTERRNGAIINVASTAAFQPVPNNATYAATKAFVLHFSEALHEEAKSSNVRVTCLCPGPVRTEFQEVAGLDEAKLPSLAWVSVDRVVESALSAVSSGRAIALPGMLNRVGAMSSRLVPRFVTRQIAGAMFRDQGPRKEA